MIEVLERKGRPARLNKDRLRMIRGTRYATRKSIARVIRKEAHHVAGGSEFGHRRKRWAACASVSRLRIGCHVFEGEAFKAIRAWAFAEQP